MPQIYSQNGLLALYLMLLFSFGFSQSHAQLKTEKPKVNFFQKPKVNFSRLILASNVKVFFGGFWSVFKKSTPSSRLFL